MNEEFYKAPPSTRCMYRDFIKQWTPVFPVRASDAMQSFIKYYDNKFCIDFDDFFIALKENGYTWNKEDNTIIAN
jgi:hypothetical protein